MLYNIGIKAIYFHSLNCYRVVSGLNMIFKCKKRDVTIAAFALSAGFAVTACPEIFDIFPDILKKPLRA